MTCLERTQCIVTPPPPPPFRPTVKRRLIEEPEIRRCPKVRRCCQTNPSTPTASCRRDSLQEDTQPRGSRTEPRTRRRHPFRSLDSNRSPSSSDSSPSPWPIGEAATVTCGSPPAEEAASVPDAEDSTPSSPAPHSRTPDRSRRPSKAAEELLGHLAAEGSSPSARPLSDDIMGNCIARKDAAAAVHQSQPTVQSSQSPAAAESSSESNGVSSSLSKPSADQPEASSSSPKQPDSAGSSNKYGNRRRLSLIHAEPITHASEEGPRGVARVYPKKPVNLETKLSLEGILAQNGAGTRVSVAGTASHRAQTNFEAKVETLRGNARATVLMELGIGHVCRKGLKPESPNQDDFFIYRLENIGLYGVFDGHGPFGHDIANFVQQNLPKFLYNHDEFASKPCEAIRYAFSRTQHEIERSCERRDFDAALSGCTATVVIHDMAKGMLYVGHVGDSRAVIGRRTEKNKDVLEAVNLTEDHKPTLPREKARIEAHGGEVKRLEGDIPHRVFLRDKLYPGLAMSRALGDLVASSAGVSAEPDIGEWKIDKEKDVFLIICSDGVWEFISSEEAVKMVPSTTKGSRSQVQHAADLLARESWNRWIQEETDVVDDITVEVIFL